MLSAESLGHSRMPTRPPGQPLPRLAHARPTISVLCARAQAARFSAALLELRRGVKLRTALRMPVDPAESGADRQPVASERKEPEHDPSATIRGSLRQVARLISERELG